MLRFNILAFLCLNSFFSFSIFTDSGAPNSGANTREFAAKQRAADTEQAVQRAEQSTDAQYDNEEKKDRSRRTAASIHEKSSAKMYGIMRSTRTACTPPRPVPSAGQRAARAPPRG